MPRAGRDSAEEPAPRRKREHDARRTPLPKRGRAQRRTKDERRTEHGADRKDEHRTEHASDRADDDHEETDRTGERHSGSSRMTARKAARAAAEQVASLTGRKPEGVTSAEQTEEGWRIGIEVVEAHRIPDSTDVLAEYRVEVDNEGEMVSYRRAQRYYRGRAEEE